ncbi:MAG: deoxyguanosinetriphosphate triphosphohydrolase [Verrucomicrobia bacterium]|nr:deoxyguanosinetriphosphate triphosphohydrolase [Verrucomicrobiota bacterium]
MTHSSDPREALLAPFAQKASESAGRLLPESEHSFRSCYQRDRDRVVHGTSFRRLDGKTQVFLNGKGDHYRTRLTHTIEVASVSRTIARALGLNEDLAEAIALAHDLGHPPFGHAGEETLDRLMKDHGGFDHNEQSLRVVETLEESYPQHQGLNLTHEVLEGLKKHHREIVSPDGARYPSPSLEAQVANIADEIAYYSHDLEDGLASGLLSQEELMSLDLWREADAKALAESSGTLSSAGPRTYRKFLLRCLINREVEDLVQTSHSSIVASGVTSVGEVRHHPTRLIGYSSDLKSRNAALRRHLYEKFYRHPEVHGANENACQQMESVFADLISHPEKLGVRTLSRLERDGLHRVVADYVAGMTDSYLRSRYEALS